MDFVQQITATILPKLLPDVTMESNEAGLLNQFIAIFAGKIAGSEGLSLDSEKNGASIMQSVFEDSEERGELIANLSETHGVDTETTQNLITKATPFVSGELNSLAEGGSLQTLLEGQLPLLGNLMPDWSANLMPEGLLGKLSALGVGAGALGAGANVLSGRASDAVGDITGSASDAVNNMAGSATDAINNVTGNVGGMTDKSKDLASGIADAVSNVSDSTTDAIENVAESVGNIASGTADAVGNVTEDAVDTVSNIAGKVGDIGTGAAASVAGAAGSTAAAGGGMMKSLLPIFGLIAAAIIAFFLLKSCNKPDIPVAGEVSHEEHSDHEHHKEHEDNDGHDHNQDHDGHKGTAKTEEASIVSETVDHASLAHAKFAMTTKAGELADCSGMLGNEDLKNKILTSVKSVFGDSANDQCSGLAVDAGYQTTLPNQEKLADAFAVVKEVDTGSIAIESDKIIVNAGNPETSAELADKLKGILPDYDISVIEVAKGEDTSKTEDAPKDKFNADMAVKQGIEGSLEALSKLSNTSSSDEIAKALNIQVINFATGKNDIPEANQVVLNKAAELLTGNAKAKLDITGHTDSRGNEQSNIALSERRAKAVMEYLVNKGASADQLSAKGVGSAEPIAKEDTEEGLFQNRRISFSAIAQ